MNISRNSDWLNASRRLEAFWHNEIMDRPCIQVFAPAPKEDYEELESLPAYDYEMQWNEPKVQFERFRFAYMHGRCLGEAFPVLYPNWCGVQEMLGAQLQYDARTIWVHPTVESILDVDVDALDIHHPSVARLIDRLSYCAEHAAGEAFIGLPPMGNPGDTLAMTCGYGNLCIDLVENPEAVISAEAKMTAFWKKLYDAVYNAINQHLQGSCGWLPAWHPSRSVLLEFDFCALISPDMFRRYLPQLLERASHGERCIYHLDGPDALTHLDTLLAQKEIHAIQWEPGIACTNILQWLPVMQKIQAAGKGLYIASGARYSQEACLELLKNLKPEGLILSVGASSVEDGERFLETVQRMY